MKSVFFGYTDKKFFCECLQSGIENICAPRGRRNSAAKYYLVKLRLEVKLLTFLYISFERKGTPDVPYTVPSIGKWYPFQIPNLELYITFSCRKCTVVKL